jgi:hypothetical protein
MVNASQFGELRMRSRFTFGAVLALWLAAVPIGAACAGELADFNIAVEKAVAHGRVALGYLRNGNVELAAREVAAMKVAWSAVVGRFGAKRPDAFDGNAQYGIALTDISTRIVTATIMLNSGRPDAARDALKPVRSELSKMRRASGLYLLPDCVLDANAAMDAFFTYREDPPDWTKPGVRFDVAARATAYSEALKRCDRMAAADVRGNPKFRRLIDGAMAGLALVPRAIATRDNDLLHRILIELRSFDRLLAFRYG